MSDERRNDDQVTRRFVVAIAIEWNATDDQFADVAEALAQAIKDNTNYPSVAVWLER